MSQTLKPYAVHDRDGLLIYIGMHASEDDCWRIYLGCPTVWEVRAALLRGLTCGPVIVTKEPTE